MNRSNSLAIAVRAPAVAVVTLAMAHALIYLDILRQTLAYPYPLNWIEGGSLDVISRVRDGLPIYVKPTVDYVPYIYTPLYYWLAGAMTHIFGLDFFAARIVSLAGIVGATMLIWLFVRGEGGSRVDACAGVGLFLGTYHATDRWFHVARVDSLCLCFLLAGLYFLRFGGRQRSIVASAVFFSLAFMTKQTALICLAVTLPVMALGSRLTPAGLAAPSWRRPAIVAALTAVLLIVINIVMQVRSGGWWGYFVYEIARSSSWRPAYVLSFWRHDLVKTVPVAVAGAAAFLVWLARHDRGRFIWQAGMLGGLLAMSWLSRINSGGAGNVLMPAFAALAIAMPLGLGTLARTSRARVATTLALVVQLALLVHGPSGDIPTAADRAAGDRFVEFLRHIEGEVIIFDQRFVETRAGKKSWGLEAAAEDVMASPDAATRDELLAAILDEIASGRVAGVIDPPRYLRDKIALGPPLTLFRNETEFKSVSGFPQRPNVYYAVTLGPTGVSHR